MENYEQKYKQALKRARIGLHDCNLLDCDDMTRKAAITTIYNLFPELADSEDEKIRKCVKYAVDKLFLKEKIVCDVHKEDVLAWLEQQGEQPTDKIEPKKLDPDKVIEWLNDQACLGWIEDVEVDKFIEQFKKDFGL